MPIYAYKCDSCQHDHEALQKFSDDPLTICPKCGQPALKKQLSTSTGFCLMGYGWHKPGMTGGSKPSS